MTVESDAVRPDNITIAQDATVVAQFEALDHTEKNVAADDTANAELASFSELVSYPNGHSACYI